MKKKTILALIMGGSMMLTACGKSAAVSEAVENASIQQSIEDSGEQETSEAETSASSESKHSRAVIIEGKITNSAYEGSINENGEAGTVSVKLDDSSTWTLTADAYITEFDGNLENVTANGHHLYVNGEQVI